MMRKLILLFVYTILGLFSSAQGYLHVSGKNIVNGIGEEVILRGIGTGNWLIQEGYMMNTASFAGTQHEITQKLIQIIGKDRTDLFYTKWLNNHFTRTDVDSLKKWGFNSVRVAMHYKWLTLPIEQEPTAGKDTWIEDGFNRLDSLLKWCSLNKMYLILDLHAAPGGQGHDANISDYDPAKPSLWENAENRRKTVALWLRLAQRYANEPWIGGYDLINEPNWELTGGKALRDLYLEITRVIRMVDNNHILFIEGNWFANDYTGLTPPWDNNMVYSGHKYWTYNNPEDLNYMLNLREYWKVPVWLGESGENSNSWFTSLIELCEKNKLGWSWWPVKKAGINNVLQVPESQNYNNLLNFWKNNTPAITGDQAFSAVMEWADNHQIKNCEVKRDVIDAMIRQPFTNSTKPFRIYKGTESVHAVNYDLGKSSYAYMDIDTANYQLSTNTFAAWNQGWTYRNDGVDIEKCTDTYPGGNGYSVGWTESGEWLQYTLDMDSIAAFTFSLRSASNLGQPGIVRLILNGADISRPLSLPNTGGWNIWNSTSASGIIIPKGRNKIRLYFERGGSNINLFSFTNPVKVTQVPFSYIFSETNTEGNKIILTLNKNITTGPSNSKDFQITVNGSPANILSYEINPDSPKKLMINLVSKLSFGQSVKISYNSTSVRSDVSFLEPFTNVEIKSNLPSFFSIPARIEAENFAVNNGFQLEDCTDSGGGKNTAFANNGDYLDYKLHIPVAGDHQFIFRVASAYNNGKISIKASTDGISWPTYGTLSIPSTGGWQAWSNQNIRIYLPAGNIIVRLYSSSGEYNINWFSISSLTGIHDQTLNNSLKVYPNPGPGLFTIESKEIQGKNVKVKITDMPGHEVYFQSFPDSKSEIIELNLSNLPPGYYLVQLSSAAGIAFSKLIIQ